MENSKKNKIAVIIPWYGKIPHYLPFFLKGLSYNTKVLDILFFTDLEINFPAPSNFRQIPLKWEDLLNRIKSKIHPEANITSPYKLCDLKPMYGHIFEEELKQYEFWGYGDVDLIYGNLQKFLPQDGIENYDIITFRENLVHGPFTLIKNTQELSRLYQQTNKLEKILTTTDYIGFDEAGRCKPWRNRIRLYNYIHMDDFWDWSTIVQHNADNKRIALYERYYAIESIPINNTLQYNNGTLRFGLDEYAYFHWVYHKKCNDFTIPNWGTIPDHFHIHPTGFYKKNNFKTKLQKAIRARRGKLVTFTQKVKDSYNYRVKGQLA